MPERGGRKFLLLGVYFSGVPRDLLFCSRSQLAALFKSKQSVFLWGCEASSTMTTTTRYKRQTTQKAMKRSLREAANTPREIRRNSAHM